MSSPNYNGSNYYRDATGNFGANLTPYGRMMGGSTPGAENAYRSRVRSTLANGAGPNRDPIAAPWSFSDFAFGRSSAEIQTEQKAKGRGLVFWIVFVLILWFVWKKFIK